MRRILAALLTCALILALPLPASAQQAVNAKVVTTCGAQTYTAGQAQPVSQNTAGTLCDGSSSGTVTVAGNIGGYEFNASVIPTVQNASYSAGQAVGGLQTISIGTTNSLAGILTQIQLASKGGSTNGDVVYVWSKNPSGTTCTDKSNFVASQTDNEFLVVQPQLVTLALVLSAQDTITYASASNLVGNFVNGSTNTDLYACIVTNATVTPGSTIDIRLNIQGTKDAP